MVAHTVQTFDEQPPIPTSMVAHIVATPEAAPAAPPLEEWKKDAFEAMNKAPACHNVVPAPGETKAKKTYKIVMIRHGESEWNKENRFCGWFDAGLSEKGNDQN